MDQTINSPDATTMMTGGFVPFALIGIAFAIGNYFLARRIDGASPVLWAVLSLIPGVNLIFFYYVAYKVVFAVLDRLPRGPHSA